MDKTVEAQTGEQWDEERSTKAKPTLQAVRGGEGRGEREGGKRSYSNESCAIVRCEMGV